jgi:hypothetical protein
MHRRNEYKILVGKLEGRKPLRRMDPRDIAWEDVKCSLGRTLFHGVCYITGCVPHIYHKKI